MFSSAILRSACLTLLLIPAAGDSAAQTTGRAPVGTRPGCDVPWPAGATVATTTEPAPPATFGWTGGRSPFEGQPLRHAAFRKRLEVGATYNARYGFAFQVTAERHLVGDLYAYDLVVVESTGSPEKGYSWCVGPSDAFHSWTKAGAGDSR